MAVAVERSPVVPDVKPRVVVIEAFESHAGEPCDCMGPAEYRLMVGDTLTLTESCREGHTFTLNAKVKAIY